MYQNVNTLIYKEEKESLVLEYKGQKLEAVFHTPQGCAYFPALLICPGFGSQKTGGYRIYVELARLLAQKGIATLRFDYRGYGESDGLFADVTLDTQVQDTLTMLNYLGAHTQVTKKGVLGTSLGARIAIHTLLKSVEGIEALALWVPLVTHEQWQEAWKLKQLQDPDFTFIDFCGQRVKRPFYEEFFSWQTSSSLSKLTNHPFFVAYAEEDEVLDKRHIEQLKQEREGAHACTSYHLLEKSNHRLSDATTREKLINVTTEWLFKELGGGDDPF